MSLIVENIGKRYGQDWALRGISFRAGSGLVGLVGPNGSGKTTLMRILATLVQPDEGQVTWDGIPVHSAGEALRARLGYLPQDFGFYPSFTARQFLHYLAIMKGLPGPLAIEQVEQVLDEVDLSDVADRKLSEFSPGTKQRVGIAQALLNDPELLIVDEPTAGLDPEERIRLRSMLAALAEERLVILSTHIIADLETVASRLILLAEGRILGDTTPEELVAAAAGSVWTLTVDSHTAGEMRRRYLCSQVTLTSSGCTLRLVTENSPHPAARKVPPNLEEAYLYKIWNA